MMNRDYITIKNATSCREEQIPVLGLDAWRTWVLESCKRGEGRIVSLFGSRRNGAGIKLTAVVGIDPRGDLRISSTELEEPSYPSLTPELPQAHLFERELCENLGVTPVGHQGLKPVRSLDDYRYYSSGEATMHEVAVGPVHAGVIEPGHFRFLCAGEKVSSLEVHLGYQRRGIEDLIVQARPSKRMVLSESIAGDSVISHGLAYCHAIEGLANREVTQRARVIRAIALELERIANHVGDLGAIANDVGYLPAASYFGALRAEYLNMLMTISGSRFGRSLLRPGGVRFDILPEMSEELKGRLAKAIRHTLDVADLMFGSLSVLDRLERTGTVDQQTAKDIGMVGVAGRASGLQRDVRCDYPSGMYKFVKLIIAKAVTGDVFARTRVRHLEIKRSSELISDLLNRIPSEKIFLQCDALSPSSLSVCLIEGWRGEIVHIARTNEKGELIQYKIVDPSFHNWTGLEVAMRNGQVSDFPLCNKSFNLSYAGYDL